jgi:flagella basal body P-ring formation protein FlgA
MEISNFLQSIKYCLMGLAVLLPSQGVLAQEVATAPVVMEAARLWLNDALLNLPKIPKTPLRMVLVVGELDTRLRLAPCTRMTPYVPVGARLWGKTRIGLRCLEGATKWNVFLPITIHAFGPAWVVKGNINAGATLVEDDGVQAEVDWAESPSPVVSNATQWIGAVASGQLVAGQVLRQASIRPAQVFMTGALVRVLAQGPGFTISTDGQALSSGVVGQLAQVKMENGRILAGIVLDSRTVKLDI